MSQVVTNPSPRQRYQEDPKTVTAHRDLIGTPMFQAALDFALLQYQHQLTYASMQNFNEAGANQFKLVGANEYINVLRNLAESPQLTTRQKVEALNHNA